MNLPKLKSLFPSGESVKSTLSSRFVFCLGAAALMVLLRLLIFDYAVFFKLEAVPNHDMYGGASFFATSMHSLRLSGEIAWWNPITHNGYAQYYQSFFSPLAPTSHHVVFIFWALLIRALSGFGIHIAEYRQYLIVTYIVLPFLSFSAFAYFASLLFRHRATVFLMLLTYVFSGIGLWNSAWFFFQEPFSFFFLLAAALAALQRPTPRRFLILAIALLVQLTSANYWTVFNSWFFMILAASYWWVYPNQVRRLFVQWWRWVKQRRLIWATAGVLWLITLAAWMLIMGTIVREQSGKYVGQSEPYTAAEAYGRVREIRRFTTELFNPNIQRALISYPERNDMHSARYLGVILLPLLIVVGASRWRRRERWLIVSAAIVLVVCLAPPFLLALWERFPFMSRIRHVFDFYTYYWELLIVFLAGAGMEILLTRSFSDKTRLTLRALISGLAILSLTVMLVFLAFSQNFRLDNPNLQANLHVTLLVLITSVAIIQLLRFPTIKNRRLFVFLMLVLGVTDLTRYFWEVNRLDRVFTAARFHTPVSLPAEAQQKLRAVWPDPNLKQGFEAGRIGNLPVANDLWPYNIFMRHRDLRQLFETSEAFYRRELEGPPLEFFSTTIPVSSFSQTDSLIKNTPELSLGNKALLVQDGSPPTAQAAPLDLASVEAPAGFTYQFRQTGYNDFDLEVSAPQTGWLLIRQLNDPTWKVILDGQPARPVQANVAGMGLPLATGRHSIHMEYRPLARRLYWSACALLCLTLLTLGIIAGRSKSTFPET